MSELEIKRINAAADAIRARCGDGEIGLILGSGLADAMELENTSVICYDEIPDFPVSTAAGHKSEWVSGTLHGKKVHMMRGRFHRYEGWSPEDIALPVRVMKKLGIGKIIVTNAAGGVNLGYKPGDLMLISDHINFGGINPLIGQNIDELGVRFPDMSRAYSAEMRAAARKCAEKLSIDLKEGVYIMFSGPSYETPAEIRMARTMGADAVGMSTVPEVIAARHCGIEVVGISCISNMAAGILDKPLTHAEVMETGEKVKAEFSALVDAIISEI